MQRRKRLTALGLALSVAALLMSGPALAAITATATRGEFAHDLDGQISSSDLLQGLIATELPGDNGWHPANPASGDSLNPNGLPAFTDGASDIGSNVTGLLNDFPGDGTPTKLLQYDFDSPVDIDQIHILTGNANNSDGRIFSTFVIRVSTDSGANYAPVGGIVPNFDGGVTANNFGYYQSDASGKINNESGMPGTTEDAANLVEIFDDGGAAIATGVTNIQFDFYAVDNTAGEMRDPWGPQFVADFDEDDDIDGDDFLTWQRGNGITGTATLADGDANIDQNVDADDLGIWQSQFGMFSSSLGVNPFTGTDDGLTRSFVSPLVWEIDVIGQAAAVQNVATLAAVPEPSALASLLAGLLAGAGLFRGKRL